MVFHSVNQRFNRQNRIQEKYNIAREAQGTGVERGRVYLILGINFGKIFQHTPPPSLETQSQRLE